ncbi:uncharacterized protein PHALS_15431 [Plasmopara halstedii]|uniref:Uncharacterized protein n=1 Tax=Plasmopara halstedii TaxID=4781 RepID=A0A0N7L6N0_PLAHL|nr:uncharacterized protein PHALS_15431 [Plasmopara halstedii]CEG44731.1 hypothetical protein PHALS_15431 [Plasmopara halstedii]|eukprot:XP_024581100.1 hypothetical protein PHALS_15431 [Plasmopara halstedii]
MKYLINSNLSLGKMSSLFTVHTQQLPEAFTPDKLGVRYIPLTSWYHVLRNGHTNSEGLIRIW